MSRKPIIAGNWKMNLTVEEGKKLAKQFADASIDYNTREVVISPSFVLAPLVKDAVKGSQVDVAVQNVSNKESGAYTGEVSCSMLKSLDFKTIIIGHSERRSYYNDTDAIVNEKVKLALANGFRVILCIGEQLEDREAGVHFETSLYQLGRAIHGATHLENLVIAYEPVWAIGTGKTASAQDAEDMHAHIRAKLAELTSKDVADKTRILYGGSVKPESIKELMGKPNVDGALVGGASLKFDDFIKIINF